MIKTRKSAANGRTYQRLCSPPVAIPLKLRGRGGDAWVEDANGVLVVDRTHGFASEAAHEDWCRWVVAAANAERERRRHARGNEQSH